MPSPHRELRISGRKQSLFRVAWRLYRSDDSFCGLVDFAVIGAVVLLFLYPSAMQSLGDVIYRASFRIESILISRQTDLPRSDSKNQAPVVGNSQSATPGSATTGIVIGNAPRAVRTIPIITRRETESEVSSGVRPRTESPGSEGSAITGEAPHVVKTVPIISRPPSVVSH